MGVNSVCEGVAGFRDGVLRVRNAFLNGSPTMVICKHHMTGVFLVRGSHKGNAQVVTWFTTGQ